MKKIKIGYVSPVNPEEDRIAWSGTYYNTFHAIRDAGIDVKWISYGTNTFLFKFVTFITKCAYRLIYGKGSSEHSRIMAKVHGLFIKRSQLEDCDVVFIPAQIDMVVGIRTNLPIIYYADGTFKKMINYQWFGYTQSAIREGEKTELLGIAKAKYNFRSSQWAADSTIKDYGAPEENTYIFPFGADVPQERKFSSEPIYKNKSLKLLFSGKEWERKGGNIAVDAARYLNGIGIKTTIFIVGVKELPKQYSGDKFIKFIGYLDKNNGKELKKYLKLYSECNAFILPTRAECAGIVFAEANSYGMPIFATDTGGIGNYVINGVNGYRLPLSATGKDFGKLIEKVYKNREFSQLSKGALKTYSEKTNWKSWSDNFRNFIIKNF